MRVVLIGVAVVLLATACGTSRTGTTGPGDTTTPAPGASELTAQVLSFDAAGTAPGKYAALSDEPIRLDAFAGWYGGAGSFDEEPEDDTAKPGSVYLAATDSTGCRTPESVRVTREGDDLRVAFEGGQDHPECVRAVGPVAYLALPADETDGVTTVNGKPLLDAAGPGKLTNFVPLGTIKAHPAAAELPDRGTLRAQLAGAGVDMTKVDAVLKGQVPAGQRRFAFLVSGCQATGAVLLLAHQEIDVALTGEKTACIAPEYFFATFTAAGEDVPEQAKLAPR